MQSYLKVGTTIKYRGYDITRHLKDDYVMEIGSDTLKDAKDFIDRLIALGELESESQQAKSSKKDSGK